MITGVVYRGHYYVDSPCSFPYTDFMNYFMEVMNSRSPVSGVALYPDDGENYYARSKYRLYDRHVSLESYQ